MPRCLIRTLALAGALLAGCSTAEFNRNASAPDYPPYDGEVAVLTELPPAGQFERLGVGVATGGDAGTRSALLRSLKKKAAAGGANAIMLQRDEVKELGTQGVGTQTKLAAWALRVRR